MQRLRSTFKRSRTPTGAEMKSQSSLDVPKQVRSASFDEIQLEAQRQSQANVELKSIANIAMATSSSLSAQAAATTTPSASGGGGGGGGVAAGGLPATPSSSSSSYSPSRSQTADYTSTGAVRKEQTLRIPNIQSGQRSKSFDVAERTVSLLDRSSSISGTTSSSSSSAYNMVARWRSSDRDSMSIPTYTCWHCVCVERYKASIGASIDSWEDEDDEDGDDGAEDADGEYESGGGGDDGSEKQQLPRQYLSVTTEPEEPPATVQLERDPENLCYFVVVQKASEEPTIAVEEDGSDCSRREGSPEIRVTLTTTSERTSTDVETDSFEAGCELYPETRQRRRSLSRQEALTAFPPELPIFGVSVSDEAAQSSPDEDDDEEDNDSERGTSADANLGVRDIFLTVPELKRDRAASVDSCFNNNKNGKIETCYSLQVPQQSARSKSVDIVLPTDVQTRYTALVPGSNDDSRTFTG